MACQTEKSQRLQPRRMPTGDELIRELGIEEGPDREPVRSAEPLPGVYLPKKLLARNLEDGSDLSGYKGRWLLLNFFTTYSVPSQHLLPKLQEIAEDYKKTNLAVAGISLDLKGAESMVGLFAETLGVTFDIYLASFETQEGQTPYGYIQEIPLTLLVDPAGRMVKGYVGPVDLDELRKDLDRHLGGPFGGSR